MNIGYTPGSFYKRFHAPQTNMQKMNRQAMLALENAIASAGSLMFDAPLVESQGRSELAAEQLLLRVQEDAKAQAASPTGLGALLNQTS